MPCNCDGLEETLQNDKKRKADEHALCGIREMLYLAQKSGKYESLESSEKKEINDEIEALYVHKLAELQKDKTLIIDKLNTIWKEVQVARAKGFEPSQKIWDQMKIWDDLVAKAEEIKQDRHAVMLYRSLE
jgi:hypothetical protein